MLKTGAFIKRMSLEGKIIYFDMREVSEVMKALRIIGANVNQIANKTNAINNIYSEDVEALRKEVEEIVHILTLFLSNLPKVEIYFRFNIASCETVIDSREDIAKARRLRAERRHSLVD